MTALVLLLCAASAGCYNSGVVLQASAARHADPARRLRPVLLVGLLAAPVWVWGTLLNMAGWGLQVWALTKASLTFVQPALGVGVFFLLAFAWLLLDERPGPRELVSACALAAGVALLSLSAPPPGTVARAGAGWAGAGAVLGAPAIAPYLLRPLRRTVGPGLLAASAGCAFALSSLTTAAVSRALVSHRLALAAAAVVATAVLGLAGFLTETSALVSGHVTAVVPVLTVVTTAIPVALAPVLFAERWPTTGAKAATLAAGLVLAIAGAAALAGSRRLARLRLLAARGPSSPARP